MQSEIRRNTHVKEKQKQNTNGRYLENPNSD